MNHFLSALSAALLSTTVLAQTQPQAPAKTQAAPLGALVSQVKIPYEQFTLANGLRVIVHTDRKAPVVAVSVWYHIGSKDEPAGKTGFAHLFEHLMFYGSENADGPMFARLEAIGATDLNGTTWFDRTNYFETVPTGALDRALFLESDRMGHLLGAVTQGKLDAQRGVVQNEKRMGDNNPGGLTEYAELDALFPVGHPYHHSTIGSMADLNGASLADVKGWFRAHYGPNNAVLVLAGDIDAKTAREKVEHWFGAIPRGPVTPRPDVPVPTLKADVEKVMRDRVATVSISREWVVPGVNDPANTQLKLAMAVLGGLGSSRLQTALVRQDKTAVNVSANVETFEKVAMVELKASVRPGVDPAAVATRLDAIVADFLKTGPTADELQRAQTTLVAGRIRGLEQVGGFSGKAVTLAEGAVYSDDPDHYRKSLAAIVAATPASVADAARTWLGRPSFKLTLEPGERSPADLGLSGSARHPAYFRDPAQGGAPAPATPATTPAPPQAPSSPRIAEPPVLPIADMAFPKIERARLSNGIEIVFARRATLPLVQLSMMFDAGNAADDHAKLGTEALLLSLLKEGTTSRDSVAIAEEQERLGGGINVSAGLDTTTVTLSALKPNLGPSLDLMADVIRNPAFAPAEIERQRNRLLARIAAEKTEPMRIGTRLLPPILYGAAHPYGVPFTGSGDEAGVKAVTRDDLLAFQRRWLRPDNATIVAVGDTTLAEIVPMLESRFGKWAPPAEARGVKSFAAAPAPRPRIILIDKPQSPQSMILAGQVLPIRGTDDTVPLNAADDILGGSGTSRLSMDLRETRSWAYYAGSQTITARERMPMMLLLPVQTDKTGPSIAAARADIATYLGTGGTTPVELTRTINSLTLSLPGSYETSGALLSALQQIVALRRPDDYYAKLPGRIRALTPASVDRFARGTIDPAKFVWVVIGDAKAVRPQLEGLGLPIETATMSPAAPEAAK